MVDFRYHLVSLVSVFLALAVGIVLGAGPLKQPIGDSLQNQVDSLRTDRDNLRTQNETATTQISDLNEFIVATAPKQLRGTLKNKSIALLRADESDSKEIDAVENRLGEAGAKVVQAGTLTDKELDSKAAQKATTAVRKIDSSLPDSPAQALPLALAKAIGYGTGSAKAISADEAKALQTALSRAGLLRTGDTAKVSAVVVVLGEAKSDQNAQPTKAASGTSLATGTAVAADVSRVMPAVAVASREVADAGTLAKLRSNETRLSTVDSLDLAAGPVITALVLANRLSGGKPNAYGFGSQAELVAPGMAK